MKTSNEVIKEIERLLNIYSEEVLELEKKEILKEKTAKTYLLHSKNFVRWIKEEFEPGNRKK